MTKSDNKVEKEDTDKKKEDNVTPASFSDIFDGMTSVDYVMMFLGTIGGIITGASIPFFNVLFGNFKESIINIFNLAI